MSNRIHCTTRFSTLIHAELTVGFIGAPYYVYEEDGFATVMFGILDDDTIIGPSVNVSVELFFSDITAIGKFLKLCSGLCPFCCYYRWQRLPELCTSSFRFQ